MAAGAQAAIDPTRHRLERRARTVWMVLTVTALSFLVSCGAFTLWLAGILNNLTTSHFASLEARTGSQLVVQRKHVVTPELITGEANLNEGDEVQTGSSGGAFLQLFDGSTIQTYFGTSLRIERLRTSKFFQNMKEASVVVNSGTVVVVTSDLGRYSEAKYLVASPNGVVEPDVKSKVRVRVEGPGNGHLTSVFVEYGTARLLSHGKQLQLTQGKMARIASDGSMEGPGNTEEELIRNGTFIEDPTSGAELTENGGLGTAAWLPIRTESAEPVAEPGVTAIVEEALGTAGVVRAISFRREGDGNKYTLLGIRQEINQPVEFLDEIELYTSVKIVGQSVVAGGPQENIYPLTIKIIYSDSDQKQHEWRHSFYYLGPEPALPNTSKVLQGTWGRHRFVLKSSQAGGDIAVINAIEVYGYGTQFQSWATALSMVAR